MADLKRVLLIDDDEMLHKFLERALTRFGYTFTGSLTAQGGINAYKEHHESIALVLLDLSLPDLRPEASIEALLAVDPSVKIVISSGALNPNDSVNKPPGVFGYLPKPFTLDDLKNVIASAI